jgi:hypothetical protein
MREDRYNSDKLGNELDRLGREEIPELLAALAAKAGVSGLSSEDESLLEGILRRWYEDDRAAAVDWVLALGNEKDRRTMLGALLELETKRDLDGALAFLDEFNSRLSEGLRIPPALLEKAAARDVDTLMRVCLAGMGEGDSTGGYELAYVKDFDFEAALNALADAESSAPDGHRFSGVPGNLLQEWSKRDPQAALDWLLLDKDVVFNSGMQPFIDGYREVANDADMGAFIAHVHEVQDDYRDAWHALSQLESEGVVRQFLASAEEHGPPEQHIQGLLRASMTGSNAANDPTRAMLLSMVDADTRYRMFTSGDGVHVRSDFTRKALRPVLEQLGHSPAEIGQMLAAPTRKK